MIVTTGTRHIFGSGSGSVSLSLDAERVLPEFEIDDNGFIAWLGTDVPAARLRATKLVRYRSTARPGGTAEFHGSGRHFIKWLLRCQPTQPVDDPLSWPIWHYRRPRLPRAYAFAKNREECRIADDVISRIKAGELFMDNCGKWFRRKEVRLADGSRAYVQRPVYGVGNFCYHTGPHWSRVLEVANNA